MTEQIAPDHFTTIPDIQSSGLPKTGTYFEQADFRTDNEWLRGIITTALKEARSKHPDWWSVTRQLEEIETEDIKHTGTP